MTTYVYETIPRKTGTQPKRFEIKQSMSDTPLTRHPETGEPFKRVITGGFGFVTGEKKAGGTPAPSACGCGAGGHSCARS